MGLESLTLVLFAVRVFAPALVLLSASSIVPTKAPSNPPSPVSPITSAVAESQVPRRGLILSFLTLASFSYFFDGFTFVICAVLNGYWPPLTVIELSAILGITSYGGLAALGAYKDIGGVNVWSFVSIKYAILLALPFDTALVVLLAVTFKPVTAPAILHIAFPVLRVLLLVPLFFALHYPHIEGRETPTASSFPIAPQLVRGLVDPNPLSTEYGTFSDRSLAPGPNPSWSEFQRYLKNIIPDIWPSESKSLQVYAVSILIMSPSRGVCSPSSSTPVSYCWLLVAL